MKIRILSFGEKTQKWIQEGIKEYQKRLQGKIKLELEELTIAKRTKSSTKEIWLATEAKTLLSRLKENDYLVILDVKSKIISTEDLANSLKNWKSSRQNINILIGGPDGIDDSIKKIANEKISLSKMTFPHTIVRIILAEQIYRAQTILDKHPYHK